MGPLIFNPVLRHQPRGTDALLSLLLSLLLTVFGFLVAPSSLLGQSDQERNLITPYTLSPGDVITRNIQRNETHTFRLSMAIKESAHVVVRQKGVDLVVRLLDSTNQLLIKRDSPNGKFGPEAVSMLGQSAGSYIIEVSADQSQPAGAYELKVEGPREAKPLDDNRVAAERLVAEAEKLTLLRTTDSRKAAVNLFRKALQLWRELGDAQEEGYTLTEIGETFTALRKFPEAIKYLYLALPRLKAAQDVSGQAYLLNALGTVYRDLGDEPLKALPPYEQSISLRRSISDRWGEAQIYNNLGFLYSSIGEQRMALDNFERAIPIWCDLSDRRMEMNTLNNIAKANLDMGNTTEAFRQFQEILDYCAQTNDRRLEPFARNSQGVIYEIWAEPQQALNQYYVALNQFRETKNRTEEAITLDNIGMIYAGLADAPSALDEFQDALKIREEMKSPGGESVTRSNIGYAQLLLGNHQDAIKQLDQALRLSQGSRNQSFEAHTLTRMGMVHLSLGETAKALECYNQALKIQNRIEDRRGQAITLDKIGELYRLSGKPAESLQSYRKALELWKALTDDQGQALSLYGIASLDRDQHNLAEARDRIVEAIEKVESVRTRMTSHRLRLTYFAARQDYYELEIDIRMRLYELTGSRIDLESALFASERARARNLLDLLADTQADIRRGVDPPLLNRERLQRDQLADAETYLQMLLSKKHSDEQRTVAERTMHTRSDEYDRTQAEIRRRSPVYAALTQPQPLRAGEIRKLLDDDTVLLEYALGEKRSYLWAVTPDEVIAYSLPGRAAMENATESFREALTVLEPPPKGEQPRETLRRMTKAVKDYPQRALDLSRMLLAPAASKIKNKRVVIVADGVLHYVPFGALPIPTGGDQQSDILNLTPMLAKHEVVYAPSASALALVRSAPRPNAPKTVAVLADPVLNKSDLRLGLTLNNGESAKRVDPRPSIRKLALRDVGDIGSEDENFRFERLQYSADEADFIVAAAAPGSWMKAVGFNASRATALSPELGQFKIVHFATHGMLNGRNPELSGLVLSLVDERGQPQDGFLRLGDIYNLDLPIELVVLSACRTGVGKQIKGEGLIGLTRGFMHAGAARVVASLWRVDDEVTAELMKRFYGYMLRSKLPAAAALRRAQLDIMLTEKWKAPYYWAGFVLQGEWK